MHWRHTIQNICGGGVVSPCKATEALKNGKLSAKGIDYLTNEHSKTQIHHISDS